eukprot:8632934-Pyramimonas_sp.AAC.1
MCSIHGRRRIHGGSGRVEGAGELDELEAAVWDFMLEVAGCAVGKAHRMRWCHQLDCADYTPQLATHGNAWLLA